MRRHPVLDGSSSWVACSFPFPCEGYLTDCEIHWCIFRGRMGLRVIRVSQCVCIDVPIFEVVRDKSLKLREYRSVKTLSLAVY
eukprot:IDg6534t1